MPMYQKSRYLPRLPQSSRRPPRRKTNAIRGASDTEITK